MGMTLAEGAVLVLLAFLAYRMLEPLQKRLEKMILRFLDPQQGAIIDAEIEKEPKHKSPKEQ